MGTKPPGPYVLWQLSSNERVTLKNLDGKIKNKYNRKKVTVNSLLFSNVIKLRLSIGSVQF